MWNIPSSEQLALLPRLYETEHISLEEKIIHMHFFLAGCDWYIAEYDGDDLFWGYVILNNDYRFAEWGLALRRWCKRVRLIASVWDCAKRWHKRQ